MKYKAVFFDADGVLIKSKYLFTEQLERDFGMKIENMLPFFTGVFRQCSIGKADMKEELAKVIDDWEWEGTLDELVTYWFSKGTEIEDEVVEYVQALKADGLRCFLATDQEKYRGEHLRNVLGGGKVFEEIYFSAEIGYPKKTESFWEHVFTTLGEDITREEVLFIDDDEENVEAVRSFGIDAILFQNLEDLKKQMNL